MSKLSDLQDIKELLDVDFRKDKFLENSYNNSPCFGFFGLFNTIYIVIINFYFDCFHNIPL